MTIRTLSTKRVKKAIEPSPVAYVIVETLENVDLKNVSLNRNHLHRMRILQIDRLLCHQDLHLAPVECRVRNRRMHSEDRDV